MKTPLPLKRTISLLFLIISTLNSYAQLGNNKTSITNQNQVLPVTLLSYSVKNEEPNKITVRWTTANETNNSHFDINISKDGKTFVLYAKVQGNGTKNTSTDYQLVVDVKSRILTGSMFLSFLLLSFLRNRKLQLILFSTSLLIMISCSKKQELIDGDYYYIQLKQVDNDGLVTTLGIVAVKPKVTN